LLSFVSAYFTIYAFDHLKDQLRDIHHLDFLFGEPRFLKSLDLDRTETKAYRIEDEKLQLRNRLQQKRVARECAIWLQNKVNIKSIRQSNLLYGKLEKAMQRIAATFKKRTIGTLLSGRGGKLLPQSKQAQSPDDFEFITWLVIRAPQ